MKKIPTLFVRDLDARPALVTLDINPVAQWVTVGQGVATQKMDGTCCLFQDGQWFKRRAVKPGSDEPDGFILAELDTNTGKKFGWVPVGDGNEDRIHREGIEWLRNTKVSHHVDELEGTYELCGPSVNGNPEGIPKTHVLFRHNNPRLRLSWQPPRDYDGLVNYLARQNIEGIVWHHTDGRMVKIKGSDFGIRRG